jgi:SAM-dependent methyltransferase
VDERGRTVARLDRRWMMRRMDDVAAPAAARWARELAAWGIPREILDQAPQSPWIHPVALFVARDGEPRTPSRERAVEAIPADGSVLDVGCGGGRAALAVAPPAVLVIGVDHQRGMLDSFAAAAAHRGLQHSEVLGQWPEVAAATPDADVVVCHHVAYNVAALRPFALALSAKARRRVVLELPARHPLAGMAPLWRRFWQLQRPAGPTADDAAQVLREAGLDVRIAHWDDPAPPREASLEPADQVRFTRIRLCLPATRDPDVAAALAGLGPPGPRRLATIWWDA